MKSDDFSLIRVTAKTHPAEYSIHKYWARKPHNVVRRALQACHLMPGDLVIDPFCGSGVPLSEAAALGATCIGVDVNPAAVEISRLTMDPPEPEHYRRTLFALLDRLDAEFSSMYDMNGRQIRYAVHATVTNCPKCGLAVSAATAPKKGRSYLCSGCGGRLSFNLENLVSTEVLKTVLDAAPRRIKPVGERPSPASGGGLFDHEFTFNPRILAFQGMRTSNLFTARNFAVLTRAANLIADLPPGLQNAAMVTLTASVAQCSRLIPYRNNLTTGGPAWTVPGFWVPPLHLESNPLKHLRARAERVYKGICHLQRLPGRGGQHRIVLGDSCTVLGSVIAAGQASVAFLDPPYGDSVPYVEFSAIWNSFLRAMPDPGQDIAISNRARGDSTWEKYSTDLTRAMVQVKAALKPDGRAIVTFNNKDLRSWRALLTALQTAGFRCEGAFYQHPAVVSAKAQLAQDGSYVGDVYCLFRPSDRALSPDLAPVRAALVRVLAAHDCGGVDDEALQRVAILEWLRANVDAGGIDALPQMIDEARKAAPPPSQSVDEAQFAALALATAEEMIQNGPLSAAALAAELHRRFAHLGVLSRPRLRLVLEQGFLIENGYIVRLPNRSVPHESSKVEAPAQPSLF